MVFVLSKWTTNDGTDQKIGRVKLRRVHLWGLLPLVSSQMWYYGRDMDIRVPPSYGSMGCLVEYIMIWILRVPKSYIKWYEILEVEFPDAWVLIRLKDVNCLSVNGLLKNK